MKIAVIGASGNVGSRIVAEALDRGHAVTAIVRHPEKLPVRPNLTAKRGDVTDENQLAEHLAGHDAVISSVRFVSLDPHVLLNGLKKAGVKRLLMVGGAGSLEVAAGKQLVDQPTFPAAYRSEAQAGRDALNVLRGEREIDWTFLSPSALFVPGERSGKFRLGQDQLLVGPDGESKISYEDFAVALIDELQDRKHSRQRFTVGY